MFKHNFLFYYLKKQTNIKIELNRVFNLIQLQIIINKIEVMKAWTVSFASKFIKKKIKKKKKLEFISYIQIELRDKIMKLLLSPLFKQGLYTNE